MMTILVIEDNEQNMYLTTYLLEQHGYHVLQAMDGTTGIAVAEREVPSLIILDIQLPKMDGYTVAMKLRAIHVLAQVPIIAMTAFAMVGDQDKILKAGFTGYLEKPINPDVFISQIAQYLLHSGGEKCPPS